GRMDAHLPRRQRHDLHQPHRPRARARVGAEARLLKGLRGQETPVPARDLGVLAKPVDERRERAGFRREVLALRALLKTAAIEEIPAIERLEQPPLALR